METFLSLAGLGKLKDQQQIALKLHRAFPDETVYLNWALLSMILQEPGRSNSHTGERCPMSISIAYRCLQTLLNQCVKLKTQSPDPSTPTELEDPNNFWMVLQVLEMVGQFYPGDDGSKVVGISKLKYPESLFEPSSTSGRFRSTPASTAPEEASALSQLASLSIESPPVPNRDIDCGRPELPQYIARAREDYFKIFDSSLGQMMRLKYLNLELMWRQRAVEWANSAGLKELIDRMKKRLESDDHNWSTMITLNQGASNLLRIDESSGSNEYDLVDHLYLELNAKQNAQNCIERGYALARVDLRCRVRDPSLTELKDSFHPLAENLDQLVLSYFEQFGEKTCCFDDLAPYFKLLSTDELEKLRVALAQHRKTEIEQDPSSSESFLRKQISLEKILRSIALPLGDKHVAESTRLLRSYFKYLPLGKDLPTTTLQPADGMALLAAQALIEDWEGPNGSVANLYAACYVLEGCLARSAQQYQARSLLIRLYRLLGALPPSFNHFVEFGIKHIQHDTLSHLGLDRCSIFFGHTYPPAYENGEKIQHLQAFDLIEYPATFYEHIEADTSTWISKCYMSGNYIKVEDLSFFKRQINCSLQKRVLRMERVRLLLFEKTRWSLMNTSRTKGTPRVKSDPDDECPFWDPSEVEMNLSEIFSACRPTIDNRDFTVIPDCRSWSTSGTCHQTNLGPPLGNLWLYTMSLTYTWMFKPQRTYGDHLRLRQPDKFPECTSFEVDLFHYSKAFITLICCEEPRLLGSYSQSLVGFFQRRNDELEAFTNTSADASGSRRPVPPSQLLAIIHCAYEGLCFLEVAHERYSDPSWNLFSKGKMIAQTIKTTRTKILAKVQTMDLLIQKVLDGINHDLLLEDDSSPRVIPKCLFASLQMPPPWAGEPIEGFGTLGDWNQSLSKLFLDQRDTLIGWHSLIKLYISSTS
ncbi:hypothetical protein Pst134EA_030175 [Puccinia striiformis f. sp. tritici]|uniref:hypothetical protein n=1 Tax=Puccinia striiformis f. sp. tritici TaxID=168172 RepID=UPI002007542D|nr:hypothetical protein Pst134EA_030175 [Puccinia striiformis f. sp. tritici]KAH9446253.1 hypothetical protein Pst134EA_030175 [Puccinia striiformis f. sp. tritici]KAI9600230.1 hypothetical protein H4Q26_000007 [Puccinia striiformis f. sp. tritici PST-130]